MNFICNMGSEIILLQLLSQLPGVNELNRTILMGWSKRNTVPLKVNSFALNHQS